MYICICVCNFICICGICNQQNKFWVSPKTGYIYIFIGQHGTFNGADNDKPWDFVDSLVPHHDFFFRSQELYSYVASLPLVDWPVWHIQRPPTNGQHTVAGKSYLQVDTKIIMWNCWTSESGRWDSLQGGPLFWGFVFLTSCLRTSCWRLVRSQKIWSWEKDWMPCPISWGWDAIAPILRMHNPRSKSVLRIIEKRQKLEGTNRPPELAI